MNKYEGNFEKRRRESHEKRKKICIIILTVIIIIGAIAAFFMSVTGRKKGKVDERTPESIAVGSKETQSSQADGAESMTESETGESSSDAADQALEEARTAAAMYDYDKAIEIIKNIPGYANDAALQKTAADFESEKSSLVPWKDMSKVTHIFFHSLIWDCNKAFSSSSSEADGYNMYMTTVEEFKKILQSMYDRGYVMVSLHDLVKESKDENGNTVFVPNDSLMLPPGKTPFIMSQDDVCFYHYMDGDGFATKIVIGDDGKPTCEYVKDDHTVVTGAYELVPILDEFVREHPGFSYRGRKAILALTGYDGVLGYRTDPEYKNIHSEHLVADQVEFLKEHPDFDWDKEVEQAKAVAQCLKDDGYEFASHTWGHIHCDSASMEQLAADTKKWEERVVPIIGETDILIFPHGADFGDWHEYSPDNERFNFFKKHGFNYFCNVDGNRYFVQITGNYVRTGRRNADGYRMYDAIVHPERQWFSDLFDVNEVFDPQRPTPVPGVV